MTTEAKDCEYFFFKFQLKEIRHLHTHTMLELSPVVPLPLAYQDNVSMLMMTLYYSIVVWYAGPLPLFQE